MQKLRRLVSSRNNSRGAEKSVIANKIGSGQNGPQHHRGPQAKVFDLLDLPLDILRYVTEFLSTEYFICLSIISKHFYRLFFSDAKSAFEQLSVSERWNTQQRLLLLLETDSPRLMRCFSCCRLYDWKKDREIETKKRSKPKSKIPAYHCPHRANSLNGPNVLHLGSTNLCGAHFPFRMEREYVDLMLRHALLGPEYGLPLSTIEHTCQGNAGLAETTRLLMRFVPQIKNGQLLLWSSYKLAIYLGSSVIGQVSRLDRIVCRHISGNLPAVALCVVGHLLQHRDEVRYKISQEKKCQRLQKCAVCHSDIRVTAEMTMQDFACIRVDAFQNFGGRVAEMHGALREMFNSEIPRSMNVIDALTRDLEMVYFAEKLPEDAAPVTKEGESATSIDSHVQASYDDLATVTDSKAAPNNGDDVDQAPQEHNQPRKVPSLLVNGGFGTMGMPNEQFDAQQVRPGADGVNEDGSCLIQQWRFDPAFPKSDQNTFPDSDITRWHIY